MVSMKSGLEDRNNLALPRLLSPHTGVSMKSGLEDRNNWISARTCDARDLEVSMKSGLEDRNNDA